MGIGKNTNFKSMRDIKYFC